MDARRWTRSNMEASSPMERVVGSNGGRPDPVGVARSDGVHADPMKDSGGSIGTALPISLSLLLFISLTLPSPPFADLEPTRTMAASETLEPADLGDGSRH
jgi:hypothetical protein